MMWKMHLWLATAALVLGSGERAIAAPPGYVETTVALNAPPVGLAFGDNGVLYALEGAEFGNNQAVLRTLFPDGTYGSSVTVAGDDPENFFSSAIGYDPITDRVLITDNTGDGRLYAVDSAGARDTIATAIAGITGVAVRSTGEIFVSTAPFGDAGEVRVVDRITGASTAVLENLGFGAGIAFDADGDLVVLDANMSAPYDGRVQRLPIDETPAGLAYGAAVPLVSGTQAAAGLAIDREGDVFITGNGGLFALDGEPLDDLTFSSNGSAGQFSTAIAFDAGMSAFEPFAGPDGGRLAFMADFGFQQEDSFVTIITPARPEDFNSDGVVGAEDLVAWSASFGAGAAERQQGDADADGDVDGRDFLDWQRAVNEVALPASNSLAVPEPAAFGTIAAAIVPIAWQTRRRR
ncbi:MAG TPA: hypothetical protein VF175_06165 [Lacipirellula sp.]